MNANTESITYTVELPVFQGPLDLLLSLIEREEMDITKISLAQVTDQYLAHLDTLQETDPDELTDFLVIAAKLVLIKSEVLLPSPPPSVVEEQEEDVGDELVRQLRTYKQFKEVAAYLRQKQETGQRNFVRLAPPPKIESKLKPGEGDLAALLRAAQRIFAIKPPDPDVDEVVSPVVVTIGQQIALIRQEIMTRQNISFRGLLSANYTALEVIVTFLAVLELIKHRVITVKQNAPFDEIILNRQV